MGVIKRVRYYCLLLLCMCGCLLAKGQTVQARLQQKLVLTPGTVSSAFLLTVLKQQAGLKLSYNPKQLPLSANVEIKSNALTVQEVLQVLQSADIHYRIIGGHVILQTKKAVVNVPPSKVITAPPAGDKTAELLHKKAGGPATSGRKTAVAGVQVKTAAAGMGRTSQDTLSVPGKPEKHTITAAGIILTSQDTLATSGKPVGDSTLEQGRSFYMYAIPSAYPRIAAPVHLLRAPVPAFAANAPVAFFSPQQKKNGTVFYVAAGIATDEIWRVSPVIEIGVPWLFAVGAWNTNFTQHSWSYGLGTSLRLSDQWKLGLTLTTGTMEKKYLDTLFIRSDFVVKGRLTRGGITLEKQLSEQCSIRFGPVMNILKTTYYLKGVAIPPPRTVAANSSPDKLYVPLKVPYTLSNTYSPSAVSNTKTWIGVQVSIFYRPDFFTRK